MVGWGEVTERAMFPKCNCYSQYHKDTGRTLIRSEAYEWDKVVPTESSICDIGGGNGHAMLGLVQEFRQLKIVLQDLPTVVQQGQYVSQNATIRRHDAAYKIR